jgi:FkbM family methyltransferase
MKDQPQLPWGTYRLTGLLAYWVAFLHAIPPSKAFYRLALWLRNPVKKRLKPWVDLTIWGLHLRLRSRGNLSEQRMILMPQFVDALERQILADTMREGGVFLDIGANAGLYSLWVAAQKIPNVRVHAFEPDPELCVAFNYNLQTNALEMIQLHAVAVGAAAGTLQLISSTSNKGENRVAAAGSSESSAVPVTTLPLFMQANGLTHITALKIDIEGQECAALKPLFEICPRSQWPQIIICEIVHDSENTLAQLLATHGYQLTGKGRLNGIYKLQNVV